MQNTTTSHLLCPSPTRAQEAQSLMTNENKPLQWAMVVALVTMAAGIVALVAIVGGAL